MTVAQPALPVVVIGGGIVGISTAIWLQRAGQSVVLIDRGDPEGRASFGNAGVLAASSVVPVTVPGLLRHVPRLLLDPRQPLFLKWSYLPRMLPWLARYLSHCRPDETRRIATALKPILGNTLEDHQTLAHGTPAAARIVPSDFVLLFRDRATFAKDAFGWSLRRDLGYEWEELDAASLHGRDSIFAPDLTFAVRIGQHGRISDPGAYIADLTAHFTASGGRLVIGEAEALIRDGASVTGVRVGDETVQATAVAVTAGAWSTRLTQGHAPAIPLESERGYHLDLWEPNLMPRVPTAITSGKFILTPMEGRLRAAGMVEFAGLNAPASKAPFDLLRTEVKKAIPGLTWTRETRWMGHRPAPSDSIPIIGAVPGTPGLFLGFGHQHVGLTGGPRTGQLLAQIITGATPNIDLSPYAPGRFD